MLVMAVCQFMLLGLLCWAQHTPDGFAPCREESGSCYALDIGGTNFRVAYYKLSDKHGKVVGLLSCTCTKEHLLCTGILFACTPQAFLPHVGSKFKVFISIYLYLFIYL